MEEGTMKATIFRHPTGLELIVAHPNGENIQAARDLCPWFNDCKRAEETQVPVGVCFQLRDDGTVLKQWT
jgi:hypothetical protein